MNLIVHKGKYIWKLRTSDLYENEEKEINWLHFLPEKIGTKYDRSRLILSSQRFLIQIVERPYRKWRSRFSAATFDNWYRRLRLLVRWMVEKDLWKFSSLDIDHVISFLCSRKARHGGGVPTEGVMNSYLIVFEELWVYRHGYPDAIRVNVYEYEDEIRRAYVTRATVPWRAINEDYALNLIRDALEWIRNYGQFFIDISERIYTQKSKWVGISHYDKNKLSTKMFTSICEEPIFIEIAEKAGCNHDGWGLAKAFTVTIGAAINALLFIVGQRVSELTRLDKGCVRIRDDELGQSISYLYGIAAKKGGSHREWVAGAPVPEIVDWIEKLHRNARESTGIKALFVARTSGSTIPLPGRKLRRMSTASPVSAMLKFANAPFRAAESAKEKLHPHAARKTFAAFVVRRDKTALEALSLHFGHAYRAFTDGHYAGNLELQKLLEEADREELGRALAELLVAPVLAGRAASTVESYKGQSARFRGKVVLQRKVDELISKGVQIAPCNWGYCLYSQSTSSCKGDKLGPNELQRSPDVCAGCANFVVTKSHAGWWNERVESDNSFLANPTVPLQSKKFVGERLAKSQQILRQLILPKHLKSSDEKDKKG
jgi:integrase